MTNDWNRFIYSLWPVFYDPLVSLPPLALARRRALAALHLKTNEAVLLVGVGTGADLPLLPRGVLVSGIDLSPAMLNRAREKAARLSLEADLQVGDAQQLPYADQQFDAAVLSLILAVVPDPRRCLAETARVLRPGGRAVVFDKFLPAGATRPHPARRLLNLVTRTFGSEINRRFDRIVGISRWRSPASNRSSSAAASALSCCAASEAAPLSTTPAIRQFPRCDAVLWLLPFCQW